MSTNTCDSLQTNLLRPLIAYGQLNCMLSTLNRSHGTFYLQPQLSTNSCVVQLSNTTTPYDGITGLNIMFDLNASSDRTDAIGLFETINISSGATCFLSVDSMFVHIYELLTNTDKQWQQRATIAADQRQLCVRVPAWFSDDYNRHFPLPSHLIAASVDTTNTYRQGDLSSYTHKLLAPRPDAMSVLIQLNESQQMDSVVPTIAVDAFALDSEERRQLNWTVSRTFSFFAKPEMPIISEFPIDKWVPLKTQIKPGDVSAVLNATTVNHAATDFIFVALCQQTQKFLPIESMRAVLYSNPDTQLYNRTCLVRINAAHLLTEHSNLQSPHVDNMLKHKIYHYVRREGFLNYSKLPRLTWEIELVNPATTPVDVYVYSRVWNVLRRQNREYNLVFPD